MPPFSVGLASLTIFSRPGMTEELLLRGVIPESLDYTGVFDNIFGRYLKSVENAGVQTTGMGSMFRLFYKIRNERPRRGKSKRTGREKRQSGNRGFAFGRSAKPFVMFL